MTASFSTKTPAFLTPIAREDLFDTGTIFPREELTRRILSFFWRDCCCPACFSRAPAPVIETAAAPAGPQISRGLRAWWLLEDGILEDPDGPNSERLRPFFEGVGRFGQLWPRYEFHFGPGELDLELRFHREPLATQRHPLRFAAEAGGRLRVLEQPASPRP